MNSLNEKKYGEAKKIAIKFFEKNKKIKIILKKIGEGHINFWSIIPFWQTKEYKDIKIISLSKGNHKED